MLKFKKAEVATLLNAIPSNSELFLVHDQGVYLISFTQPPGHRTIINSEGCDANKVAFRDRIATRRIRKAIDQHLFLPQSSQTGKLDG